MNGNARIKANVAARSIAQIGLARNEAHEYFLDGQGPIPSVTTILKIVDKSGPLIGWAKRITAEAALRHAADLPKWVEDFGGDGAVGMLTKATNVIRDKAANAGSEIHQLADAIVKGHEVTVPEELQPYVNALLKWQADFEPEYLASEEMVYSRHGYAGTLDAICRIAGETWLVDYKTSRACYPETGLQLAAYAFADHIGRPGDPLRYAIPKIDQFAVVHIRPEGAALIPYEVTEDTYAAFLQAKRLSEWHAGPARSIVGQAVGPALLKFPVAS